MASKPSGNDLNSKWRTEGVPPPISSRPSSKKSPKRGSRPAPPPVTSPPPLATVAVESEEQAPTKTARTSAWLLSVVVHLGLLVLLAMLTYRLQRGNQGIAIDGSWGQASSQPALQVMVLQDEAPEADAVREQTADQTEAIEIRSNLPSMTAPTLNEPPDTETQDASAVLAAGLRTSGASGQDSRRPFFLGGGSMRSRLPDARRARGERYGATLESEEAVERALRWLADHQRPDGSWSFDLELTPCNGRCRHGKPSDEDTPTPSTAATGLALLAFLGAGYTHHEGPYQETVSKGLYYLKSAAAETQFGYDWQQGGSMYGHGIALLALSEAMQMTKLQGEYDTDLMRYVQSGSFFTTMAQHESGSWGYTPGRPGDTTLTGWQVLSLLTSQKAGVQLQSGIFKRTLGFLDSVRAGSKFEFGYRSAEPEPTTTAIALVLLLHLRSQLGMTYFDRAFDKIADSGPTFTNVYHDYYATMALHHVRHRDWETWNTALRDHLVETQERSGHEAGSWHFQDKWGDVGGRVYTTAMCALTLEVYYRYLPMYETPEQFPL